MRRVVETALHDLGFVRQSALNLISDGQRSQELFSRLVSVFGGGEHRAQVIARMAGLILSHVVVHEIQIACERRVIASCSVRRSPSAANERAQTRAAELVKLCAQMFDRLAVERAQRAAE